MRTKESPRGTGAIEGTEGTQSTTIVADLSVYRHRRACRAAYEYLADRGLTSVTVVDTLAAIARGDTA